MADYWNHWVEMGENFSNLPKIFQVNWFRKDKDGKFIWPGFGENSRVLAWIVDRLEGKVDGVESPLGVLPKPEDLILDGLDISKDQLSELFNIDKNSWLEECQLTDEYFEMFGDRVPKELEAELTQLKNRLATA